MSLLDMHDEILAYSLESKDYFGRDITFTSSDGLIEYTISGSVNIVSKHVASEADDVKTLRSNCTVRFTTLAEKAGYPGNLDWNDNLPVAGWTVATTRTSLNLPVVFTIEPGSDFPDYHLPMVTYFLANLEVEEV